MQVQDEVNLHMFEGTFLLDESQLISADEISNSLIQPT